MSDYQTIMPQAHGFGIPLQTVLDFFATNKEHLRAWNDKPFTQDQYIEIAQTLVNAGSQLNAGSTFDIARQVGCSVEQAQEAITEIMNGFTFADENNLLKD